MEYFQKMMDRLMSSNGKKVQEDLLKNPEQIHTTDYLQDDAWGPASQKSLDRKLVMDDSQVCWTKCEWKNVKGMKQKLVNNK